MSDAPPPRPPTPTPPPPPTAPPAPATSTTSAPPPPATSDRTRAFRVGVLAVLSLAILVVILIVTGPLKIVRGDSVDVDFAFAGPIKPGASVRISGVVVGAVTGVDLLAGQDARAGADKMVRVRATIEARALAVITERARFRVTTLGVLGEHYLDVEPVAGGTQLRNGARVDGVSQARPDLLLSSAAGLLQRFDDLLPRSPEALELMRSTSSLMKRLDALLAQDRIPADDEVRQFAADIRTLVHGAAVGVGDGRSIRATFERLPKVLDDTDKLVADVSAADVAGTLKEVRAALAAAEKTLDLVDRQPLADPAKQEQLRADVTAAMKALDVTLRRADRLMAAVEEKRGAAGKLFWDEEAAGDLKAVLKGFRENPVKFFLNPGGDK